MLKKLAKNLRKHAAHHTKTHSERKHSKAQKTKHAKSVKHKSAKKEHAAPSKVEAHVTVPELKANQSSLSQSEIRKEKTSPVHEPKVAMKIAKEDNSKHAALNK